jgi:uncharacterized membrane protein
VAGKETVSSAEVLAEAGTTKVKPTFVQLAGLWLAAGVGTIIAIVRIAVIVFVYMHYPVMPSAEAITAASADSTSAIEQYKELSQIAIKNGQDLFQTIVTQALLPVLTAILGYIFGKSDKPE